MYPDVDFCTKTRHDWKTVQKTSEKHKQIKTY